MDSSKLPIWSCIFGRASSTTTKVVNYLSKIKFNGESNSSSFHHVHQFILNCKNYDIDDGVMCNIFTLPLTDWTKEWCLSFPFSYVDTWD
jgi:hypothetical protein